MPLRNEVLYEPVPSLTFDTTPPTLPYQQGRVYWDAQNMTLALMINQYVTQQIGQENHVIVRNNTDEDWPNGALVYPTGSLGYRPTGALSQANSIITALARGITTQPIPKNTEGVVCTFGIVNDYDTQTPGWNESDFLYMSPTVKGGLQNTPPTSGFNIWCAYVLRVHPTLGMIFFVPAPRPAFGNVAGGNYTQFEFDGTMRAIGTATCFRDELQSLASATLTSPSGDFVLDSAEAAITAKTSARYPTDYLTTNLQLNHDWLNGSEIHPHLHWWQTTANVPNWLIEYRWAEAGQRENNGVDEAKMDVKFVCMGGGHAESDHGIRTHFRAGGLWAGVRHCSIQDLPGLHQRLHGVYRH